MSSLQGLLQSQGARTFAVCLVSLCLYLYLPWSLNSQLFPFFDAQFPHNRNISTLSSGALLACVAVISMRKPAVFANPSFAVVMFVGAIGGSAVAFFGASFNAIGVMMAGACAMSLARACCLITVGLTLCSLPKRSVPACVVAAALLFAVIEASLPSGFSPFWLAAHASVILLILALTWIPASRHLSEVSAHAPLHAVAITQPHAVLPFNHRLFICLLLFSVVRGVALTFALDDGGKTAAVWIVAAIAILFALEILRPDALSLDGLFFAAYLLVFAGLLLIPASEIVITDVPRTLINLGDSFFEVFAWILLTKLAQRNIDGSVAVFAWGVSLTMIGTVLGAPAGYAIAALIAVDVQKVTLAVAALAFLLVVYLIFVHRRFDFDETIQDVEQSEEIQPIEGLSARMGPSVFDAIDQQCELLAAESKLTKREVEVLKLLAVGRTGTYIQNELVITYNTVKAHVKHIYMKLGVHSQQEVIDLVHAGYSLSKEQEAVEDRTSR